MVISASFGVLPKNHQPNEVSVPCLAQFPIKRATPIQNLEMIHAGSKQMEYNFFELMSLLYVPNPCCKINKLN